MTKSKYVPKRRFKEFVGDGEWVKRKLGDVSTSYSGGTPSVGNREYYGDEIPFIRSAEINSEFTELSLTKNGLEKSSAKMVNIGDILYALYGATSGEVGISKIKGAINQAVLCIIPQSEYDSNFIVHWLRFQKENIINTYLQGGQGNLSGSMVKELEINFPKLSEQRKIGKLFQKLDRLISGHQHKLDKLKDLKKSYLTEMFPAEGERVPKRRFPGFEGEWEKKKLGQLMDVGSVKRVHQSDWRNRGVRFLRARDIVSESKNKKPDDFLYIDEELYKKYSAISGMVKKGDLLVTGVGTIGVPMLVESSEPLYFKDGNIIWFKNKNLLDGHFFYYSFTAKAIQKFIGDVAGVGTVGTYTIDSGKNTPILLPVTKEEQVVIGHFFHKLDQSITLQQQKLDKLNDLKKAYLNELFV